jgi:quercetin dioxygenase-like cupin family protein
MRHLVRSSAQAHFVPPDPTNPGYTRWGVVTEETAVHTGFDICALEPGASAPARVHSYEESFFVLEGTVVLQTSEEAVELRAGDYGLVPVALAHSWHNDSDTPARWAAMLAPQPRSRFAGDSFTVPFAARTEARPVDPRDPRNRLYGHIEPVNMDATKQSQELLAMSASMRTALLVYSGITVKMMVDSDLGAQLTTMFMVQYAPDGVAGAHDHPFEETYMFLEGRAEGVFDGERYELGPGDVAFAGVGCVHGFRNVGGGPLRWLETQAPQPPRRHSYRFARDWDYLQAQLDADQGEADS